MSPWSGTAASSKRARGEVEKLASGALRVKVYAGVDPISKKRLYLRETVPAGPKAKKQAEQVLVRLLNEVYERRHPRTDATVDQLLDRHIKEAKLGIKTRKNYRSQADKHIVPCIGRVKVRQVDADISDSFYAELRRCRDHCDGSERIDHRTATPHACDQRCRPHGCKPLAESSILYIHQILRGAFRRAVRLQWVPQNPFDVADPPSAPKPKPRPPSAAEAARIVTEAWKDPDWGTLIWLTMVTGHRRGELCGIRWRNVDLDGGVLHLERAIGQYGALIWEKDTKNESDRRIVLDDETVLLLREHRQRCEARANALGVELTDQAFVFSLDPDGSTHLKPDSVTQRYGRLAARLKIKTSIHKLRHYNATELIAAGVDIRTVAGRLGHGSGGTTTLRSYTAWVSESDQRAAGAISARMPARPAAAALPELIDIVPSSPYELIAVAVRDRIYAGDLGIGLPIPPLKQLARENGVSVSTAQRAVKLLGEWGLVRVEIGRPTLVQPRARPEGGTLELPISSAVDSDEPRPERLRPQLALDLELRRLGAVIATFQSNADPGDSAILHRLLVSAVRRHGERLDVIDEYELVVRAAGKPGVLTTYVAVEA